MSEHVSWDGLSQKPKPQAACAPRIAPHCYNVGLDDLGGFYFALDGSDLERLVVRFGLLPVEPVVPVSIQICDCVADAYDQGLVHHDIQSASLFLCKRTREADFAKVLDVGIVGVKQRSASEPWLPRETWRLEYLAPTG
jgi:serine/threonine protein kinase